MSEPQNHTPASCHLRKIRLNSGGILGSGQVWMCKSVYTKQAGPDTCRSSMKGFTNTTHHATVLL